MLKIALFFRKTGEVNLSEFKQNKRVREFESG